MSKKLLTSFLLFFSFLSVGVSYAAITDPTDAHAWWNFNESSGNALDSSGNGYDLTSTDSRVMGLIGNAIEADTSGAISDELALTDICTSVRCEVGFWLKNPVAHGGNYYFDYIPSTGASSRFLIYWDGSQFVAWFGGNTINIPISDTVDFHLVTLAKHEISPAPVWCVYLDNVQLSCVNDGSITDTTGPKIAFGSDNDGGNIGNGIFDMAFMYTDVLATSTRTTLYNSGDGYDPFGGVIPEPVPELPPFPTFNNAIYDTCDTLNLVCYATTTFGFLFGYDENYLASSTEYLSYTLEHKFPIGYITDIVGVMSTTSTGTLPVISATLPEAFPFFANQHIDLDLTNSIDFLLNATNSIFSNESASSTETFYEFTNRYWKILLYTLFVIYILYRLFPSMFGRLSDDEQRDIRRGVMWKSK